MKAAGPKNYITPEGAKKLQEELRRFKSEERPKVVETVAWAASNGDRSENADYIYGKRRLREIDSRIRFLTQRLEAAEVVDSTKQTGNVIRFGAYVTVRGEDGADKKYRIVGQDEIDPTKGHISWDSPLAKALLQKAKHDVVVFRSPRGEEEIEVIDVSYTAR